jgi:UDP-N-acetylglucosamine--N-acetylmuramyl-(pentapeptide) pyrophosphoryl-undecaprenol N-acetylglucosamine transferase
LAVLERLQALHDVDAAWIGATSGVERRIVGERSIPYYGIPTGKLRRYLSLRNVWDFFRVGSGIIRALLILRKLRPVVLFSNGGFVSVPPVIAACLLGVPVISRESDTDPGLATRINARFSQRILVAYDSVARHLPRALRERVVVTGNPLRSQIFAGRSEAGLDALGFSREDPRPVVLFLGGSLGARQINELVASLRTRIDGTWRIVHQTGYQGGEVSKEAGFFSTPFFRDELPDVLAAADILVCRAGASTIWEGAALGRAMLLVPLASGSRGDQLRNAAVFVAAGAARSFTNDETLVSDVEEALLYFATHTEERMEMARRARALVRIDSADVIAEIIATTMRE